MPRESKVNRKKRALKVIRMLRKTYPDAECALDFSNPLELLVATILSAQCTDKRVNIVTKDLFKKYKTAKDYANSKPSDLEALIRTAGFYKNKAKNIRGAAQAIHEKFHGKVPRKLEELVTLLGVGRKTANVVLGNAFETPGLTVDTHMTRLNRLLGFTQNTDAVKIEFDLMEIIPKKEWTEYSHLVIHHGRARCIARRPDCDHCEIHDLCPSAKKSKHAQKIHAGHGHFVEDPHHHS